MKSVEPEVFSVIGVLPEPGGYSLAKFSRSSEHYKDWVARLTQKGAEKFYDEYYFAYGHESIADLAHVILVAENVSLLGAFEIFEEPLLDGQESSTRYQDFQKRPLFLPPEIAGTDFEQKFEITCQRLIESYLTATERMKRYYDDRYSSNRPKPISDAEYQRILAARSFDVARYLLPCAVTTGLGIVVSARTLERMINRLLSRDRIEYRRLGKKIQQAVKDNPAYNPAQIKVDSILADLKELIRPEAGEALEKIAEKLKEISCFDAKAVPTLVRHTGPRSYQSQTWKEIKAIANHFFDSLELADLSPRVDLIEFPNVEIELIATALYKASGLYPMADILSTVTDSMSEKDRKEIIDLLFKHRNYEAVIRGETKIRRNHLLPEFRSGHGFCFDLCYDFGAIRDLHRHRNCVHVLPPFLPFLGYEIPKEATEAGLGDLFRNSNDQSNNLARDVYGGLGSGWEYVLTLGHRRRHLIKMDLWEMFYVPELRTAPGGHFSYREITYKMYELAREKYPNLFGHAAVQPPDFIDFFNR